MANTATARHEGLTRSLPISQRGLMTALERFRIVSDLTYEALGTMLGVGKVHAFRMCRGERIIAAERVVAIEAATGIPRVDLRPDLYAPPASAAPPGLPPPRRRAARLHPSQVRPDLYDPPESPPAPVGLDGAASPVPASPAPAPMPRRRRAAKPEAAA